VQIVPLRPLLARLCVSVDHAGEDGLRIVAAVSRNIVNGPRCGDRSNGRPEADLYSNGVSNTPFLSFRYSRRLREGQWRLTYPHGLIAGCMAVAMGGLIVGKSARLARERGLALAGSSHCCPAERLHTVRVGWLETRGSSHLAMMSFERCGRAWSKMD
jgi:hypothetical protein